MGGLARRAGKIDTFRRPDHGLIVLDSGDSLVARHAAIAMTDPTELRLNGATIVQALGMMGTDAMVPGECDLALGLKWLAGEARHAGVPLLVANLKARVKGRSPFVPHKLITAGKVKVGLFGLVDMDNEGPEIAALFKKTRVKQLDAMKTAAAQVKALRKKGAEVIVVLAHMSQDKVRNLLEKTAGVHLAILGHHGMRLGEPMKVAGSYMVEAGRRGQELGHVRIELGADWKPGDVLHDDSPRYNVYWRISRQIDLLKQLLSTVDKGAEPPAQAVEVHKQLKRDIEAYKALGAAGGAARLAATVIGLDETVPEQAAVSALIKGKQAAVPASPATEVIAEPSAPPAKPVLGTPIQIPDEVVQEMDRKKARQVN